MVIIEFMVTEKCNLACTYCYMDNKKSFMNFETVDKFFDSIGDFMKLYNEDSYHISFFGGEPSLNWPVIEYSLPKFQADPRCHSVVMISNGLELNEERVEWMIQNKLPISLSFDGLWNNKQRPLKIGGTSLDKYMEKKGLLHKLTNGSKVMVHPTNFKTMTENHVFFVEEYEFLNPDFSLVRDNIYTPEDLKVFDVEIKRLADKVIEYNKAGVRTTNGLFFLYTLDIIVGKKFGKRPFGCFAGCHGAGFSPEGKFFPCARFASDHEYELMDSNTGIINQENVDFLNVPEITDPRVYPECQDCVLYNYCNAGCTYSQLKNGDGERAKPVESVCSLLKMCYREASRMMKELKDCEAYTSSLDSKLKEISKGNN